MKEKYSRSETENSSDSGTENEESLIKHLESQEFGKDNSMFEEDLDSGFDWLAENYTSLLTEDPYQKQRFSDSDLGRNFKEEKKKMNKENISEDDIYHYRDIDEKFVFSSN